MPNLQCFLTARSYTQCSMLYVRTANSVRTGLLQDLVGSALRRLLWVDVHVLRVSQQANPLLLLPLFSHLKNVQKQADFSKFLPPEPLSPSSSSKCASRLSRRLIHSQHIKEANKCRTKCRLLHWTALSSDKSSRIQTTNSETQSQEISEIKQNTWVITHANLYTGRDKNGFSAKN